MNDMLTYTARLRPHISLIARASTRQASAPLAFIILEGLAAAPTRRLFMPESDCCRGLILMTGFSLTFHSRQYGFDFEYNAIIGPVAGCR